MSIEGIALDHFITSTQTEKAVTLQAYTSHAVFRSFLSDDSKQDASTTIAHIKCIIELLNKCNILSNTLSTIWENIYGCDDHPSVPLHYT